MPSEQQFDHFDLWHPVVLGYWIITLLLKLRYFHFRWYDAIKLSIHVYETQAVVMNHLMQSRSTLLLNHPRIADTVRLIHQDHVPVFDHRLKRMHLLRDVEFDNEILLPVEFTWKYCIDSKVMKVRMLYSCINCI